MPQETLGEKYNITNGESVLLGDMMALLFKKLQKPMKPLYLPYSLVFGFSFISELFHRVFQLKKEPTLTRYSVSVLGKSQTLDISKAEKELGYKPNISIEEGVEEFVKWWNEQYSFKDV